MKKYYINDLGEKEFSISYTINYIRDMILGTRFKNIRPYILNESFEKLVNDPKLISSIDETIKIYMLSNIRLIKLTAKHEIEMKKKKKEFDDMFN